MITKNNNKTINILEFNGKEHNSEDIFLLNYYTFQNKDFSEQQLKDLANKDIENVFLLLNIKEESKENKSIKYDNNTHTLLNTDNVFEVIKSTGNKFFTNFYFKTKTCALHNKIIDTFKDNKDDIIYIYKNWILENGYPYNCYSNQFYAYKNVTEDIFYFFNDCIYLYVIFELHKYANKYLELIEHNRNLKVEKYNDVTIISKHSKFPIYIELLKEELEFTLKIPEEPPAAKYNKTIEKELANNYFDEMTKYFELLNESLIQFTYYLIINKSSNNFYITRQLPIYNITEKIFELYYTANSLMGIAYNQLLLYLTSKYYLKIKRKICANPNCNNDFEKNGKTKYCESCSENKVSLELAKNKYENSSKGKSTRSTYHNDFRKQGKLKGTKK